MYKRQELYGGNHKFISNIAEVPAGMARQAEELAASGKTPLFFAAGGDLIGIIAVADVIKDDSYEAVREMRNMGIRVVMLTGDNERTARAIGKEAGVDPVSYTHLDVYKRQIQGLAKRTEI